MLLDNLALADGSIVYFKKQDDPDQGAFTFFVQVQHNGQFRTGEAFGLTNLLTFSRAFTRAFEIEFASVSALAPDGTFSVTINDETYQGSVETKEDGELVRVLSEIFLQAKPFAHRMPINPNQMTIPF